MASGENESFFTSAKFLLPAGFLLGWLAMDAIRGDDQHAAEVEKRLRQAQGILQVEPDATFPAPLATLISANATVEAAGTAAVTGADAKATAEEARISAQNDFEATIEAEIER